MIAKEKIALIEKKRLVSSLCVWKIISCKNFFRFKILYKFSGLVKVEVIANPLA